MINIEKNLQEKKFKLDFLKKENIRLNKEYKKLLKENNNIKYNKKVDEKDNLKSLNKLLLESKSDSAQEIKFLYHFNRFKSKKIMK